MLEGAVIFVLHGSLCNFLFDAEHSVCDGILRVIHLEEKTGTIFRRAKAAGVIIAACFA
jgi:hypothetical protein